MGFVTLSFDCEGKWGMIDSINDWHTKITNESLITIYQYILEVLNHYSIPATFAFVGALTESKNNFFENEKLIHKSTNHQKWIEMIKDKVDKNDDGWFEPRLLELVKQNHIHEIASHSYSHIIFSDLKKKEAEIELRLVKNWIKRNNIDCKSFVYPRNRIKFLDLLENIDIRKYRKSPNTFKSSFLPYKFNNFIEELLIYKKGEDFHNNKLKAFPGGIFINWKYGIRNLISTNISKLKYNSIIEDSLNHDRCAHFWLHPHNLITSPKTKINFENVCKLISDKKIEVKRMIDI